MSSRRGQELCEQSRRSAVQSEAHLRKHALSAIAMAATMGAEAGPGLWCWMAQWASKTTNADQRGAKQSKTEQSRRGKQEQSFVLSALCWGKSRVLQLTWQVYLREVHKVDG